MGGFLAATTHAPLTSILMLFEMTLDYEMVLPLMLACVTAHYTAKVYRRGESIYDAALKGRTTGAAWQLNTVAALLKPAGAVVAQTSTVARMFAELPRRPLERAYVTDGGELVGWLDLRELLAQTRRGQVDGAATVAAVMRPVTQTLTDDLSLGAALDVFLRARANVLPVTGGEWRNNLLGEISRQDVLLAMQDRMVSEPGPSAV
jgi:CIC family chloride channel protein